MGTCILNSGSLYCNLYAKEARVYKEVNAKEMLESCQSAQPTPQLTPNDRTVKAVSAALGLSGAAVVLWF